MLQGQFSLGGDMEPVLRAEEGKEEVKEARVPSNTLSQEKRGWETSYKIKTWGQVKLF